MKQILIFLSFFFLINCNSQRISGYISRVIDGDTFIFFSDSGYIKVRMQGIDAPEHNQFYGQESKKFLNTFKGKQAILYCFGYDKYGRRIGMLYVNDCNINELCIIKGFAWYYYQYYHSTQFYNDQLKAQIDSTGLWKYKNPIPPWIFRKNIIK